MDGIVQACQHCWELLTGAAHRGARIQLLEQLKREDERCGRSAARVDMLLHKHDRRGNGRSM